MFRAHYEIGGFRFAVSTDCDLPGSEMDLLYPELRAEPGVNCIEWSFRRNAGSRAGCVSYLLYEAGEVFCECEDLNCVLDIMEWRILMEILRRLGRFVQVHAAGLVSGGKALLLIGPSGAGKTSLTLSLMVRGWKCLSDEVALIDPGNCMISPLPRSFHVDNKALDLFPEIFPGKNERIYTDNAGKVFLNPAVVRSDWVSEAALPVWIVFPRYNPAYRNELLPVGETEALSLILGQAINPLLGGEKSIETLLRLVRSCDCYRLETGDLRGASSVLSTLSGRGVGCDCDECYSADEYCGGVKVGDSSGRCL